MFCVTGSNVTYILMRTFSVYLFNLMSLCMLMHAYVRHDVCVGVRACVGVSSLVSLCGFHVTDSGHEAGQQGPLPAEPDLTSPCLAL